MAGHTLGSAFLGGIEAVQRANQSRADNVYRNRVLDLDERTLAERQRQFNEAQRLDQRATTLAENQLTFDKRKQDEVERSALAQEKDSAARTKILGQAANTADRTLDEDIRQQGVLENTARETNRLENLLPFMNEAYTDLGDQFFARGDDGRLTNKNAIIDLLNTDTEALISQVAPGQFTDKEIAGFDYDKATGTTRVLLRDRGTDGEISGATENASNAGNDPVVEFTEEEFRDAVRRTFLTQTLANYDKKEISLGSARGIKLAAKAELGRRERQIESAITDQMMQLGQPALIRQLKQDLAATQNDPTSRAALLEQFGLTAEQFGPAPDTRDPSTEFLGPDTPLTDPLLAPMNTARQVQDNLYKTARGEKLAFMRSTDKDQFSTPYPNLVAELQTNFSEERDLQTTTQLRGSQREAQVDELLSRRQELLKNIGPEIAARKVARQNFEQTLERQTLSPQRRAQALSEYDAYIEQLEGYLPTQEKAVVDVAAEVGRLASMSDDALRESFEQGTLPISQEQLEAIRQHLIDKEVKTALDLERESLTTRTAALAAIAATAPDAATRTGAFTSAVNLLDTDRFTLTENQRLQAVDAAEGRVIQRAEFDADRADRKADTEQEMRTTAQTNVNPVAEELAAEFGYPRELDVESMTTAQIEEVRRRELIRRPLLERVKQTWSDGAGAKALRGIRDPNKPALEREAFGNVFNGAVTATIGSLIARKANTDLDAQDVAEFFLGDDSLILGASRSIGLADAEMSASDIRTTNTSFQTVEVTTDDNGVPTIYRLKNPDGGVYRGKVVPADLRREIGADAYSTLLDQLVKAGKIPAQD
jgi:hypothetical protein